MGPSISLQALLAPQVLCCVLGLLAGLLGGWLLGRLWPSAAGGRSAPRDDDTDPVDEIRDLRKTIYLLQNENKNLSTFLLTLPDLARQLNSSAEKRKIPALLIAFIEQLFEVEQILIFLTANDGKHLTLAGGKGLPETVRMHEVIPFGKGRIGWVAEHQITMDESDLTQKARVVKGDLAANMHPLFRTELCAPMLSNDQTLGVISLGGLLRRPKNEKNMLKMVADLGSIAMQNTMLFAQIQKSANSDGLTGLPNKRHFMAKLADEILKADKEQRSLSLFLFDIDHFKTYNDTNGHLAGDEALKITGKLINETIRTDDLPARYGGEEFVVLLPNTDKDGAMRAAEKLRSVVEAYPYHNAASQPLGTVSISGGVATFPYDARNTGDLIRCADQALYQGKHAGRNRVVAYESKYLSEETDVGYQVASIRPEE